MTNSEAQTIDVTQKPEPLPATEFNFPKHTEHTLKNGMKVFIIEDNEQPTISFRLLIPGGTSQDGSKAGVAEITAGMLTKGAGKMKALDIANKIDGIGASVSASAGGDFVNVSATGLKKHISTILDVYKEVITKPTFDEDEFDKYVQQMIAGLQYEKSQATKVGSNLARKVIYGENHPYASKSTEKSVAEIKVKDIKDFYTKYFVPNHATIAVIGDVKTKEVIDMLEKAFSGWKKGTAPKIEMPKPAPMPLGVYFVHRPASDQSTVIVTNLAIPYNHKDYEALETASKLIGSGFGGRLFRTLRETHSFTYSPWGYLTSSKYINRFACGADVNKAKTDSSIQVIFEQINDLATNGPTDEELSRHKRYETGQYKLSFENSEFIASLIQQSEFLGVSLDYVKGYPTRINDMPANAVAYMADNYLNPKTARIIVVGDPNIRESLEKFGKVFDYNLDLEPISGAAAKMEKVSMSAQDLIERHTKALGGKEAIAKVNTIVSKAKATMSMGGQQIQGEITQEVKAPNKIYMLMDMKMFKQEIWCDGTKAIAGGMGDLAELDGAQLEKMIFEGTPFGTTKFLDLGYKLDIKGKQNGQIVVLVTSPKNSESTYYFDEKTYLVSYYESLEESPDGPTPMTVKLSNWIDVNGVKLPGKVENLSSMFNLINEYKYELNVEIDDSKFSPMN